MDRRRVAATVARNVRSVVETTGSTLPRVAAATDVPLSKLVAHPASGELTCDDLAAIGGFLSVRPSTFLVGVSS
jgi:hypothetical protein